MNQQAFKNLLKEAGIQYSAESEIDLVELARRGFSKKVLLKLAEFSSIPISVLARLLPVTERTIHRYNENDKFNSDISEHIILIARVILKADDVFKDKEKLKSWLTSPLIALGQRTPLSLLDTSFGAQLVTDELGRLEHGIYS